MNVILIGGGKTTYFLARQFIGKGYRVTIINRDPAEAKRLSEQVQALVLLGDGSDSTLLEEAGARRAEVVVALTPHDQDNLVACQLARQMYGVPRTVALVNDPENEAVFVELGVSVAFSATHIMANLIEQKMGFEGITALIPAAEGLVSMTEVVLRPGAPAIDHTLQELDLPENSLVACIVRDGQVMVPRGNSLLVAADRLILVTLPHSHGQTLRALLGPEV
jgi:trk system potassium uptake protein TrkA